MKKLFFVHIPRTGGSGLKDRYLTHEAGKRFNFTRGHRCALDKPQRYKYRGMLDYWRSYLSMPAYKDPDAVSFAIVRNPYDMLVSLYHYKFPMCNGEWDSGEVDAAQYPYQDFKSFVLDFCHPDLDWKAQPDSPLQRNLFFQLFKSDGACAVDWVLFYERYEDAVRWICSLAGIEPRFEEYRYNTSGKERLSYGREQGYKQYYDDEMIELVKRGCVGELEMFGYGFEGLETNGLAIDGKDIEWLNG